MRNITHKITTQIFHDNGDPRTIDVWISVDLVTLAERYAPQALRNKSKRVAECKGAVIIRVDA